MSNATQNQCKFCSCKTPHFLLVNVINCLEDFLSPNKENEEPYFASSANLPPPETPPYLEISTREFLNFNYEDF